MGPKWEGSLGSVIWSGLAGNRKQHVKCGAGVTIQSEHSDEYQLSCDPAYQDQVAQAAEYAIEWAGRFFKLRVPLGAEAKIGYSWRDCH